MSIIEFISGLPNISIISHICKGIFILFFVYYIFKKIINEQYKKLKKVFFNLLIIVILSIISSVLKFEYDNNEFTLVDIIYCDIN